MYQWTGSSLIQVMACCQSSAKPLPKPMMAWYQSTLHQQTQWNTNQSIKFLFQKIHIITFVNVVCKNVGHYCHVVTLMHHYTPAPPYVEWEHTGFTLMSVCPSVRHHWRNVWRNIAGSRPNWAQDFTRTPQKNNRTSQKNNCQHSRNFWNFLIITYHSYWESYDVSTYYTSKQMYNWMKWLHLLGGWHFIAATAINPPKAACQFAADDILLYEFCYYNPMDYFTIWKKEKKNCHHYNTILSLYNIISRHYKKSLLRSQICHGYEELSTDTNYPIWRR